MKTNPLRALPVLVLISLMAAGATLARDLTFEERVAAQEAIERVYYSHQIGATKPFEEAVPQAVLEGKVRKYLQLSVVLEAYWKTPVTDEMLQRELERMARGTRLPDRLRELFAALNEDPFVIKECLARATLVDRLTRNFYAFDPTLHAEARQRAGEIHRQLAAGDLNPWSDHPARSVVVLAVGEAEAVEPRAREREAGLMEEGRPARRLLSPEEYRKERARWPEAPGRVAPAAEEREAFVIRVVLSDAPGESRVASYAVPKRAWDLWWETARQELQIEKVAAVAADGGSLPLAAGRPTEVLGNSRSTTDAVPDALTPDDLPCADDDTWDNGILDDVPEPRSFHTAVWTGSVMVVWGGFNGAYLNTGGRYDPATDTWMATSTVGAPSGRYYHTAIWTGSVMVVWGGYNGTSLNTGGRYDPATDTWMATSTVGAPAGRYYHTAIWTGSVMVVWGGISYLNSGGRYDPATDTWTATAILGVPSGRYYHTAVWTGTVMVVWGGYNGTSLNTGGRYDPATNTWTATSTVGAPSARYNHTAVWAGSVMVVWGGISYLDTGGRYDPATNTWTATSTVGAPSGRYYHTAVWTGGVMVVWGGRDYSYSLNTGGQYDPATDLWMATSTVGAPSARSGHAAVWTGAVMVVWGGSSNTGGRYDPGTDAWTATSIAEAPSGRYYHTAIWTGNVMVVWGGMGDGGYFFNTGGRYDLATDSWTATSTLGAPSERYQHTAVWTGAVMVVWGGYGGSTLSTGGRYDPAADSWTETSTVMAPSARSSHTAVWTGSVMVVWGGSSLNTGGRYDPARDTWTATSTLEAPSARSSHTAIWTGAVMVVWGGSSSGYVNTGGQYDPATDTWTATSIVGAPSGRYYHTAIWTGSVMVVWGGTSGSALNTGGRYDPATDTWTATSTVGAPSGRYYHTAIWTGAVMVVWGGNSLGYVNTGGQYDPPADAWTATSTLEAPSMRHLHTAVRTGGMMVVWGGIGFSSGHLNNGGRYAPLGYSEDDDGDGLRECDGDCDDANPNTFPGAPEICDHLDNDCDGQTDEGVTTPYYRDADGDTYGNSSDSMPACTQPPGYVTDGSDCDDGNAAVHPGAVETCNSVDDDCDGQTDEGVTTPYYRDADGDTYGNSSDSMPACTQPPGYVTDGSDCDDGNAAVHPGAVETCNSADDDCDGAVDEGCPAQVLNPDNGHYYLAVDVPTGINWIDADAAARSESFLGWQGYLATLTSEAENAFVVASFPNATGPTGYWLGGYQDTAAADYAEPGGGWRWVTGEAWSYANWSPGEPGNDFEGTGGAINEDALQFYGGLGGTWNDYPKDPWNWLRPLGYVIEFGPTDRHWAMAASTGPAAEGVAYAYDTVRHRGVSFGGGPTPQADTWEWDGQGWQTTGASGPAARASAQMAFDAARATIVLFGGWTTPDDYYGDTWTYDGTAWLEQGVEGPSPRANHAMAYDSARQRIVLFGGSEYQSIYGDTWEWDGSSWTLVSGTGPSPRIFARMVYDEARGKTVLFGGQTHYEGTLLNDTWEWDGTTWAQVAATGPSPRSEHHLVYDPVRGVVVLFGGGMWGDPYYLGDTWEYAGESWLQIETAGPSPRRNGGAFFDSGVQGVYVFAGDTAEGVTAETWVYGPDTDGDGVCNPADCASADPSVWASPGEVGDVAFSADWTTMSWSSLATQAGAGTIYDVMRGDLAEFPVGSGAAETCLATDLDATSLDTGAPPGEGAGWYFLVRGRNVCATGSWGTTSSGTLRSSAACP